jgi:hypothetical protein
MVVEVVAFFFVSTSLGHVKTIDGLMNRLTIPMAVWIPLPQASVR